MGVARHPRIVSRPRYRRQTADAPPDATRPGGCPVSSPRCGAWPSPGLGAVTPVGNDAAIDLGRPRRGRSGVDVIRSFDASDFPVNIAAEVKDFDPSNGDAARRRCAAPGTTCTSPSPRRSRRRADAELVVDEPSRTGVVIGSVMGGLPYTLASSSDPRGARLGPGLAALASEHAGRHLDEPRRDAARRRAASTTRPSRPAPPARMRSARRPPRSPADQADVVLAGATESSMVPIILAGFCAMRALVDGRDDPAGASRGRSMPPGPAS